MFIYILITILLVILFFIFLTYNKFIYLNNKVLEAFSTMDVYLKKRWDLIPNLVETVKGYSAHEQNVLTEVINLRSKSYDTLNNSEKLNVNNTLANDITRLIALKEAYPELKANESFKDLANSLSKIENDIENSRKYFNGTIRNYNNKVQMFPSNIVANVFNYEIKEMFLATEEERNNIKIDL